MGISDVALMKIANEKPIKNVFASASDDSECFSHPVYHSNSNSSIVSSEKEAREKPKPRIDPHAVLGDGLPDENVVRRVFEKPIVEWVCSFVIIANAITIGWAAQNEIDWR